MSPATQEVPSQSTSCTVIPCTRRNPAPELRSTSSTVVLKKIPELLSVRRRLGPVFGVRVTPLPTKNPAPVIPTRPPAVFKVTVTPNMVTEPRWTATPHPGLFVICPPLTKLRTESFTFIPLPSLFCTVKVCRVAEELLLK